MNPSQYKLILASGSPRRQQFFKELGLKFEIRLKEIEEHYPKHLKAQERTDYLSEYTANAFELAEDELLVTSDTSAALEDTALGKPMNYDEALVTVNEL